MSNVRVGLMITERCNFKCEHCMFSCTPYGKDMTLEIAKRAGEFIREYDVDSINVYGGEPFLDIKLFDMVFNEVYESDKMFFVSTNGSFMTSTKRREYVYGLLVRLQQNTDECTGIRVSNTTFHKNFRSEKQTKAMKQLEYFISDPYSFFDYMTEEELMYATPNPFYKEGLIYIDKSINDFEMNPSGRALENGYYGSRRCYCPVTCEEEDDMQLNIKPNGDISICCTCDGCTVGNILEDNLTPNLLRGRIVSLYNHFKKYLGVDSDTKMIDLCSKCKKYKVTESGIKRR